MSKRISKSKTILLLVSLVIMFGAKLIPAPWGLNDGGFQVLATLIGALILWLSIGVDWTCLPVLMSLCMTPGLGMKVVSAGTLGSDTVMFIILCFVMAYCLEKTGVSRRICIWFLTNKVARKGPWWTIAMMFLSVFILGMISSAVATAMVALPIFYEILKELKFEKGKGDSLPSVIIFGVALSISFAVGASPIGHAQTIFGMSSYNIYTGDTLDMAEYMGVGIIICVIALIICFFVIKLFWRPDVTALRNLDYDAVKATIGPMTKDEKWVSITYVFVVIFWVLPGIMRSISPAAYDAFFSKISYWYPPIVAIVLLINVKGEDGPVLNFKQALKYVPWGTCIFVGTIMMVGSCFSNPSIGLTDWLSGVLAPVVEGLNPVVFIAIILFFGLILTNLVSNTVTVAVVFAIAMPLVTSGLFGTAIDPKAMAILMTVASNMAFATPPSSPPVAIVCDSGWVDTGTMLKWGTIVALISFAIIMLVGIPLSGAV